MNTIELICGQIVYDIKEFFFCNEYQAVMNKSIFVILVELIVLALLIWTMFGSSEYEY